jgi:hypothetical protein
MQQKPKIKAFGSVNNVFKFKPLLVAPTFSKTLHHQHTLQFQPKRNISALSDRIQTAAD